MRLRPLLTAVLVMIAAVLACAAPASALNSRSYLSAESTANDSNSCSRQSPCATFTRALAQTIVGGLISCVDPGDYGAVPITQAVTIDCSEGFATVGAVTINVAPGATPTANKSVVLRGLTLQGVLTITVGINIIAAPSVVIENVRIFDFQTQGILDQRTGGGTQLFISDTTVANTTAGVGIVVIGGATNTVVLDNVRVFRNTYGLAAATGNNVTINRSVFSGNSVAGVEGDPGAQISLDSSRVSHNTVGLQSNSSIRISNSDISFNGTAITGGVGSFGNNRLSGNSADGAAPILLGSASSDVAQR